MDIFGYLGDNKKVAGVIIGGILLVVLVLAAILFPENGIGIVP